MTKDELLKYAKENYPIGTKYKCPENIGISGLGVGIFMVELGDEIKFRKDDEIDIFGKGYIYYKGKWAEILEKPKVETKFEVGKWYYYEHGENVKDKYYLKYDKHNSDKFYYIEYIKLMKNAKAIRQVSNIPFKFMYNIKEVPLSEIQQYLPDEHPDKIKEVKEEVKPNITWKIGDYVVFVEDWCFSKKGDIDKIKELGSDVTILYLKKEGLAASPLHKECKLKVFPTLQEAQKFSDELLGKSKKSELSRKDLIEEEFYKVEVDGNFLIMKLSSKGSDPDRVNATYISNMNGNWEFKRGSTPWLTDRKIIIASSSEVKWLNTCIKQNKFIEQSELDKYDDEGNLMEKNEEYPEYVECIYSTAGRFTVNKIYKVESRKESCLVILSNNGKNENTGGYPLNGNLWKFKPSTKEAYLKMIKKELIKKDEKFKNGDWLVYIGDCGYNPSTPIKIGDVRQMIEGRFGSLVIYGAKDLSQYFRKALPHEIPINNSIKEKPKLVFPYKVGDRIRCIKLNTWIDTCHDKPPIGICEGKVVEITKVGDFDEACECIPFAATYDGVEYGFSYSDNNKYELVDSFNPIIDYMDIFNKIGMLPLIPKECYIKKQEVKNPLDDSEREVNINFSKPKQIKF